jgi:hypothetical protein
MKKLCAGIFLYISLFSYAQKNDTSAVLADITEKVKDYYIDKEATKLFSSKKIL